MAKRFTDTGIWDKAWFMGLKPKHKCLIRYLYDKCDGAGVYEPNWALASLHVGEKITDKDLDPIKGQIEVLQSGKIFIPDFIIFQCGTLSETSPAHKPIFQSLIKNSLLDRVLNRVSNTQQEKEKETEEDKEMDKDKKGVQGERFIKPSFSELQIYFTEIHGSVTAPQDFLNHYESNGWKVGKNPMKDWKAACRNWKKNENNFSNGKSSNSAKQNLADFITAIDSLPASQSQ